MGDEGLFHESMDWVGGNAALRSRIDRFSEEVVIPHIIAEVRKLTHKATEETLHFVSTGMLIHFSQ